MDIKDIQRNINNEEYLSDRDYNIENNTLINDIKDAIEQIKEARNLFNNVNDAYLIEVAIYAENVAQRRYEYLLSVAKSRGLRATNSYIIKNSLYTFEQ